MEYLYFFMLVVSLGAVLAFWAVRSARPGNLQAGRAAGASPVKVAAAAQGIRFERGAKAEAPWGWPGHGAVQSGESADGADRGLGDRLGDWVGALLQQKRTVDDEDYRVRTNESLRALVEDRYARPSAARPSPRRGRDSSARERSPGLERTGPVRTPWGW